MSIRKDVCEKKGKIQFNSNDLKRMKQCLSEAGVDDEGLSLEEIKQTYRVIHCSRDISVTVDSGESDNENAVPAANPQPSTSVTVNNLTDFGDPQWLSKMKSVESSFKYKIPKTKRALRKPPLESTNDQNLIKESAIMTRSIPSTSSNKSRFVTLTQPSPVSLIKNLVDNPFAALDDGDPRDLPTLKIRPLEQLPINISPEIAALHAPPPYNDPRIAALPYKERHAIIGKYMKDMQDMIFRLTRASPRKTVWGKPIVSSNRFKGTLDKVSSRAIHQTIIDGMDDMDQFKENSSEENESTKSTVTSKVFVENSLEDVIEKEPSNVDTDEVRTNLKTQRKRKASKDHIDSVSGSDDTDNDHPDYDEDVKRKKTTTVPARFESRADLCLSTVSNIVDSSPSISRRYTDVFANRPDITFSAVRGKAKGGKAVGKSNADIMARSSLFKDSPIVKAIGHRVLSRSRRLLADLAQVEEIRQDAAKQNRMRFKDSLVDDDDDGDFENPGVNSKRRRIPVPLPKCRPGVPRLPRKNPPQLESKLKNSDGVDVIELSNPVSIKIVEEEELPCPMCNVMFKSTIIQDHAENCEGPDSMNIQTITCGICDKVFLLNKDFEVHSSKCIANEKSM